MKITIIILVFVFLFAFVLPSNLNAQTVHSPRVMILGIDPTDQTGASLANTYFKSQMNNQLAKDFELQHAQQTINDFKELSQNRIQYVLAGHERITDFPTYPNGFQFTVQNYSQCVWGRPEFNPTQCDSQKWQFPYVQYIQDKQICQKAKALNADEVWVYSPPYILAYEAFMVGPNPGYWVNGPDFTIQGCDKHIVFVNGVYDTPNNMLHSYGHRTEATIDYLMRNFTTQDRNNYWERFAARNPETRNSGAPFCGNAHFPFNFRYEYDMGNTIAKTNTCSDFSNFPNYTGVQSSYGCTTWECSDRGWQKQWFSSIPHSDGTVSITNKNGKTYQFKKDWWSYILFPENALASENPTQATPPPTPVTKLGDANGDNKVDGLDYIAWLNKFNQNLTGPSNGDFNNSGKVDGQDYVIWLNNFGK